MPSLPRVAAVAFGLFAVLAISSSSASRAAQRVTAKLQAADAQAKAADVKESAEAAPVVAQEKPAEGAAAQQEPKGTEAAEESQQPAAEKLAVEPQAKKHRAQEEAAAPNKVDIHINVNVKHAGSNAEPLTQAEAEAVREQIVKQISTTSTKPDTADNSAGVATAVQPKQAPEAASGQPAAKQETPDQTSVEVADNASEPQKAAVVKAAVAPETTAAPAPAAGSAAMLLGMPILAAVAVFAAMRYRNSENLPEFVEAQLSSLGLSGQRKSEGGLSGGCQQSIYGSV